MDASNSSSPSTWDKVEQALTRPLDTNRIKTLPFKVKGADGELKDAQYLGVGTVVTALYEACGPLKWSSETVYSKILQVEKEPYIDRSTKKPRVDPATGEIVIQYKVTAQAKVRVTVGSPRNPIAVHEATGHKTITDLSLGLAKAKASDSAESQAFKRAARAFGPRTGLALMIDDEEERLALRFTEDEEEPRPSNPSTDQRGSVANNVAPALPPIPPTGGPTSDAPRWSIPPVSTFKRWDDLVTWLDAHRVFGASPDEVIPHELRKLLSDFAKQCFGDLDWKRVVKAWSEVGIDGGQTPVTFDQATDFVLCVQSMLEPPKVDDRGQFAPTQSQNIADGSAPMVNRSSGAPDVRNLAKSGGCQPAEDRPTADLQPLPLAVQQYVGTFRNPNDELDINKLNEAGLKAFLRGAFAEDVIQIKQLWHAAGHVPAPGQKIFRWNVEALAKKLREAMAPAPTS